MDNNAKILAVVGPTGSGKTALAVEIAQNFNGVIISADSRQVYRGLDVGTNKEGEPSRYHHLASRKIDGVGQLLIDIVDPEQPFTLNDWLEQAKKALMVIVEQQQLPIVVGGTGLYVTALLEGYLPGEGRYSQAKQSPFFQSLILMPNLSREELNSKSDRRHQQIFDQLVQETQKLIDSGVSPEWLEKIGLDYRYATNFVTGQRNRELAISESQKASRDYIRRQLTWWRHHGEVQLINNFAEANERIKKFLK